MVEVNEPEKAYFSLSLRFIHPSIAPNEISNILNKKPKYSWKAEEVAKNPKGEDLNFIRKQSYWCGESINREGKNFTSEIDRLLEELAPHREFLHQLSNDGGRISIYLHLPGSINIGDTLSIETLSMLLDLKMELDIEVFPNMKKG